MCSGGLVGWLALVDGQQVHLVSKRECVNQRLHKGAEFLHLLRISEFFWVSMAEFGMNSESFV